MSSAFSMVSLITKPIKTSFRRFTRRLIERVIALFSLTSRLKDECKLFKIDSTGGKKSNPPAGSAMKVGSGSPKRTRGPNLCWCCGSQDSKHECKKRHCIVCGKIGCKHISCSGRFDKKNPASSSGRKLQ
jgi:hypothetical protein